MSERAKFLASLAFFAGALLALELVLPADPEGMPADPLIVRTLFNLATIAGSGAAGYFLPEIRDAIARVLS